MKVITLVVGDLQTNCYLATSGDETLIIDPGDEADFITQSILENKLKPIAIVLTHGHFDHVLGCLELKLNHSVSLLLHKNDEKLYTSANQSALRWTKKKSLKVPLVDRFIKEGDKINVGDESFTVIETPGHTPGSICLLADSCQPPAVFTGDTLFKEGVGRTDFSYSQPLQLTKSLDKLFKLPEETLVYPGHGASAFLYECRLFVQSQ